MCKRKSDDLTVIAPNATASVLFGMTFKRSAHASLAFQTNQSKTDTHACSPLPSKDDKSLSIIQFIDRLKNSTNRMIETKTNENLNTRSTDNQLSNQLYGFRSIRTDRLRKSTRTHSNRHRSIYDGEISTNACIFMQ